MTTRRPELHLFTSATPLAPPNAELDDLALTAALLVVGLLPLALQLVGVGQWSGGTLGLGVALAAFAALQLLDRARVRRAHGHGSEGADAPASGGARRGSLHAG